jgi:cyclic 2,3-diphosphoglycerate synthetase
VLVDGEHYPTAVADAVGRIVALGWDVRAAVLVGGTEKLREDVPVYGVPLAPRGSGPVDALARALDVYEVDAVVDLADEPVLVFEQRLRVIAYAAGQGVSWIGADSMVLAPTYAAVAAPSLAVIGTGKRIGKTAVSAHVARCADAALGGNGDVVVVAMGRGGPQEPVMIDRSSGPVTAERLLAISRGGAHAASDYLEDAALTGLTTIGCRRVGGGLLGVPVASNVVAGARLAESLEPRLIVFEGSGSCIPPVAADASLLLASTARPRDLFDDLGTYRLARADMLLIVGDDEATAQQMVAESERLRPGLTALAVRLRPRPVDDVRNRCVAVFTTAPEHVLGPTRDALESVGARVAGVSGSLARRDQLREDVERAVAAGADTFVVEIKAAGIDVVAEAADAHGIPVVFLDNRPVAHDPGVDLDQLLTDFARRVSGE